MIYLLTGFVNNPLRLSYLPFLGWLPRPVPLKVELVIRTLGNPFALLVGGTNALLALLALAVAVSAEVDVMGDAADVAGPLIGILAGALDALAVDIVFARVQVLGPCAVGRACLVKGGFVVSGGEGGG